jgi:hypothetical protein
MLEDMLDGANKLDGNKKYYKEGNIIYPKRFHPNNKKERYTHPTIKTMQIVLG